MLSIKNPTKYFYVSQASLNTQTLATGGFISGYVPIASYSSIAISALINGQSGTLNIRTNSLQNNKNSTLFYTTTLSADTPYYKRFVIPNMFFRVELIQSSGNPKGYINTSFIDGQATSAYTFLNSKINLNSDTALTRLANDFETDIIRELHTDFSKVNINGRLFGLPAPSTSEVIGLDSTYRYQATNPTNIRMTNANDTNTGTGCRTIRFIGVLQDGTNFDSIFQTIGNTTLGLGLNVKSVNRIIVNSVGSAGALLGDVFLEDSITGEVLGKCFAGEGNSRMALYGVEDNKQLVIKDINICAYAPQGDITVFEYNPATNIFFTLGVFFVNTNYQQLTYSLNALIPAGNVIQCSFKNTSSVAAGQPCSINVNINGLLCPLINSY